MTLSGNVFACFVVWERVRVKSRVRLVVFMCWLIVCAVIIIVVVVITPFTF